MDPWSILSIAASILQLVDVGYGLVSGTKEAYSSAEGMQRQTAELRDLAKDIQRQNEEILRPGSLSKDEKALRTLVEGSLDIAQKLDAKLAKLIVQDNTKFRRLQSAKVSVKVMIWQNDLEELKKRLLNLQNHVQQRLSIILQAKQNSDLASAIRQLQAENKEFSISTHKAFMRAFKETQQLANTQNDQIQDYHGFLTNLSSQIISTIKEGQVAFKNQQIIGSLWFNVLKEREDGIVEAYDKTLSWLFEPKATNFCSWLEHGDGIFWINGLAGSGKSTLMKFAFRDKRTIALLEKWSNGRKLHVANFFFWNSGFEMQKSQRGLLQSLLCQICRSDPDLVPTICPGHHPNEPWNTNELKEAYEKLRQHESTTSAFCFFIDGLDEYSGGEGEIIDILKSLSQVANVKICASSRPWNAFEKAFSNLEHKLIVEEHTMTDMERYVHGMLEENVEFTQLVSKEPLCLEFIPEISRRAKGVWLWVFLVVKDLMRDIEGKEDYEFLKKRLDNIPPRLEAYFEDIINRIDPIYKNETAQIFLLTTEAFRPLPLITLHFIEMERQDPNYAMKIDLQKLEALGLNDICEIWKVKLKNRCRDLLKTQAISQIQTGDPEINFLTLRIEYLHRTVRDFLLKNHQTKLYEVVPRNFDPKVSLCRSMLSVLQLRAQSLLAEGKEKWMKFDTKKSFDMLYIMLDFLYYASQLESSGKGQSQFSAIDKGEKVIKSLFQEGIDPWKILAMSGKEYDTFLLLLVTLHLDQYVRNVLDSRQTLSDAEGTDLLFVALARDFDLDFFVNLHLGRDLPYYMFLHTEINLDLIEYLLRKYGDLHQNKTFQWFVYKCLEFKDRSNGTTRESWFKASKLLLQYGAQLDRKTTQHIWEYEKFKSTRDITCILFSKEEMDELDRISQPQSKVWGVFQFLTPRRFL